MLFSKVWRDELGLSRHALSTNSSNVALVLTHLDQRLLLGVDDWDVEAFACAVSR